MKTEAGKLVHAGKLGRKTAQHTRLIRNGSGLEYLGHPDSSAG